MKGKNMTLQNFVGDIAATVEITDSTSPQMAFIKGILIGVELASHKIDPDIDTVAKFFVESVKRHFPDIMLPMHRQLRNAVYKERENAVKQIMEFVETLTPLSEEQKMSLVSNMIVTFTFFEAELHKIHAVYLRPF
jgi:hypothetical protein